MNPQSFVPQCICASTRRTAHVGSKWDEKIAPPVGYISLAVDGLRCPNKQHCSSSRPQTEGKHEVRRSVYWYQPLGLSRSG